MRGKHHTSNRKSGGEQLPGVAEHLQPRLKQKTAGLDSLQSIGGVGGGGGGGEVRGVHQESVLEGSLHSRLESRCLEWFSVKCSSPK